MTLDRLGAFFLLFSFSLSLFSFEFSLSEQRSLIKNRATLGHRSLSYSESKRKIFGEMDLQEDQQGYFVFDVYCQEKFREGVGPNIIPNHTKINIEHSWPQSRFSNRHSKSIQKADLHHLFPTNSRANSARGNHIFAEVVGKEPTDNCSSSFIGKVDRKTAFMPPIEIRGDIARALFYFAVRYDMAISAVEEFYLRQWHYLDPVDESEEARHHQVALLQGNRNPFIDQPELVDSIADF